MKKILLTVFVLLFSLVSCMQQTTMQTAGSLETQPVYQSKTGDTAIYIVEFPYKKEKKDFTNAFESFLKKYPFETLPSDTMTHYFRLKIIPGPRDKTKNSEEMLVPLEQADIIETDIVPESSPVFEDTVQPVAGGKASVYTGRKFFDNTLAALTRVAPFEPDQNARSDKKSQWIDLLSVNEVSATVVELRIAVSLVNGAGGTISSFDFLAAWTDFIRTHPAEGLALFYSVKGVRKFIKGEEGVVQGFSVINEKTLKLTLDKPDPYLKERLHSFKLQPLSLGVGPFYLKKQQGNKLVLEQNRYYPFQKSFLEQCVVVCGNDKNPVVNFSLNKYDVILLHKKKDIEYARSTLLKNAYLMPFSHDRYFISLASPSAELRRNLSAMINPSEILNSAVRIEGSLLMAIEYDDEYTAPAEKIAQPAVNNQKPLTIAFTTDDPISVEIAEKIFSDLTHAGFTVKLQGADKTNFETALIDRTYDMAVGWIPETIMTDKTERLHCATIWFNNLYDEEKRIAENYEVPLFSVHQYALCKNNISFYKNQIAGICIKKEQ